MKNKETNNFDRLLEEQAQKQKEKDLETYSYIVLKNGKIEHRTPYEQEAVNLAKSIKGKVMWCVEGYVIGQL